MGKGAWPLIGAAVQFLEMPLQPNARCCATFSTKGCLPRCLVCKIHMCRGCWSPRVWIGCEEIWQSSILALYSACWCTRYMEHQSSSRGLVMPMKISALA